MRNCMHICPYSKLPCHKHKVFHITELNKGKAVETHLCEECVAKYQGESSSVPEKPEKTEKPEIPEIPEIPDSPLVNGLIGLLSLLTKTLADVNEQKEEKTKCPGCGTTKCPGCGTTPEDIMDTAKFGCSQCYDYYSSSIDHVLERCQEGSKKHVGKIPKKFSEQEEKRRIKKDATLDIKAQIKNLETKMANAVKVENYEVAQVLKFKIEVLKQKLPGAT